MVKTFQLQTVCKSCHELESRHAPYGRCPVDIPIREQGVVRSWGVPYPYTGYFETREAVPLPEDA